MDSWIQTANPLVIRQPALLTLLLQPLQCVYWGHYNVHCTCEFAESTLVLEKVINL